MEYFNVVLAFLAGGLFTFLILLIRLQKNKTQRISRDYEEKRKYDVLNERFIILQESFANAEKQLHDRNDEITSLRSLLSASDSDNKHLNDKILSQKEELENLHNKLKLEFENLANKILNDHSQKFSEQNISKLDVLLNPFNEKLQNFQKTVSDTYEKNIKQQTDLKAELKMLYELNTRLSTEAGNLTKALKGDSKKQGNWGELVLERILERSGLVKGEEYEVQESLRSADGQLRKPDVILYLPEKKHIIIDAKVSLTDYERSVGTDNEEERTGFLKKHAESVKKHVRELSEKNYPGLPDMQSPDFVLLFLPIESAFSSALQIDHELYAYAWDRRIVIVSPTTLLATLRTIESIWKQDKQNRNSIEIARQGGLLHDRLLALFDEFDKMGNQLNTLGSTYADLNKKIFEGKGNLVRRAMKLSELGVKTSKTLSDKHYLTQDTDESE